jgi:hypothetical protein
MDWIEQLLHVSPDGGSEATELAYLAVAVFALGGLREEPSERARRGPPLLRA